MHISAHVHDVTYVRLTHQRAADPANLRPVKGYHAHAEARANTEKLVDRNIVRRRPADEREHRERLEQISCAMSASHPSH